MTTKLSVHLAFAPLLLSTASEGLRCGTSLSTECMGNTDKRYDSSYINDLVAQNPIWGHAEGFWIMDVELNTNPSTGTPRTPTFYNPNLPFSPQNAPYYVRRVFKNDTFVGSRHYSNVYVFFGPADEAFCSQTPPDGLLNVVGNGTCGVNGYSVPAGIFETSTYEKDGTMSRLSTNGSIGLYARRSGSASSATIVPINERAWYTQNVEQAAVSSSPVSGSTTGTTNVFMSNFTQFSRSVTTYLFLEDDVNMLAVSLHYIARKVAEEEWLDGLNSSYGDFNVLPEHRVQGGQLPMLTECIVEDMCPSEANWCEQDPNCSQSPYQEPPAQLKAGPIVGIVLGAVVVFFVAMYAWHRNRLHKQAQRFRRQFAGRVAETVDLRASRLTLSPEALHREFEKIAKSCEGEKGCMSKEALWEFVTSGKVGEMDRQDFNALFAALDSRGDGKVDFLEFCSFLSVCGEEFREAREELMAGRRRNTSVQSLSLKESARRLSSILTSKSMKMKLGDIAQLQEVAEHRDEEVGETPKANEVEGIEKKEG